ncbi:MAG: hypothetical protein CBB97_24870 [Candidatus Endolissoclinum sp. TMED37]|nr:MAG: hypothetical protein CBB97_24870 [Candidatus Endolissoclinum sp. TMED37]
MKYRAEIDGLRALAVLPVIFFHAGFEWFSGGFVGVDVFFVISGYLITTIIISEMAEGKFSIVNFYERRARRILPALFFVMATCLPFAWLLLTPADLKDFGQSLVAVSTFSSNILFWRESGYFSTAAELKPLLHTWSLAVEEQYYILFPLFLMLVWHWGLRIVFLLLASVFAISLGVAQWGVSNYPAAAFYLLPTRGWELLCGVFSAFYLFVSNKHFSHLLDNFLSLLGIGMISFSILAFNESTPFPSLYALVPTAGTALIILFASPNTLVNRLLCWRPFVAVGLVSYSAYLWHQPVLAFAKHYVGGQPSDLFLLGLCTLSLLLAWFSWRFIEAPFRNRTSFTRASIFRYSLAGILLFSLLGMAIHYTNGLEQLKVLSYSDDERRNYELVRRSTGYDMYDRMYSADCKLWVRDAKELPQAQFEECFTRFGGPVVVLGDSHAMNLFNITAMSGQFQFVVGISQGYCRPHTPKEGCHYESSKEFLKEIVKYEPIVLYHQAGSYFFTDQYGNYQPSTDQRLFFDEGNVAKVDLYLNELAEMDLTVVWLGAFTEYGLSPHLNPTKPKNVPSHSFDAFRQLDSDVRSVITSSMGSYRYVSFDEFYTITDRVIFDNCLIWRDKDHFSTCGEKHISREARWSSLLVRY